MHTQRQTEYTHTHTHTKVRTKELLQSCIPLAHNTWETKAERANKRPLLVQLSRDIGVVTTLGAEQVKGATFIPPVT